MTPPMLRFTDRFATARNHPGQSPQPPHPARSAICAAALQFAVLLLQFLGGESGDKSIIGFTGPGHRKMSEMLKLAPLFSKR